MYVLAGFAIGFGFSPLGAGAMLWMIKRARGERGHD